LLFGAPAGRMLGTMRILRLVERGSPARYIAGVAAPLLATMVALGIGEERATTAALVYLLAVFSAAAVGGLGPGVLASVLSFLGLNFFFTEPRRTFSVGKTDDLIALVVFVTIGMAVSWLVAVGLSQRARAERRELEARSLYAISSRMLASEDLDAALTELAASVRRLFGLARCEVRIREPDGSLAMRASDGDEPDPGAEEIAVPLATSDRDLGALVLVPGTSRLGEAERRVAAIFARQTAAALERGLLEQEARGARLAAETNRVRRALLSAVSHDFRTPLASIKASLTALTPTTETDAPPSLVSTDAQELLRTALEETERLERLVANLLDLTRIRSGALAPERVPVPVDDVIEDALAGLRRPLADHRVEVMVRSDVPLMHVDPVQVGQVFRNVLQNAGKFAPDGTAIRIAASTWRGAVEVRVADRGPGIPSPDREAVFREFFRSGDGRRAGTGLGLAVSKAIVEAHGGAIWAEETPGGGATIVVRLPAAGAA
jgi:two-component system, OmpR family, sensor histidine kinase KdpD